MILTKTLRIGVCIVVQAPQEFAQILLADPAGAFLIPRRFFSGRSRLGTGTSLLPLPAHAFIRRETHCRRELNGAIPVGAPGIKMAQRSGLGDRVQDRGLGRLPRMLVALDHDTDLARENHFGESGRGRRESGPFGFSSPRPSFCTWQQRPDPILWLRCFPPAHGSRC